MAGTGALHEGAGSECKIDLSILVAEGVENRWVGVLVILSKIYGEGGKDGGQEK